MQTKLNVYFLTGIYNKQPRPKKHFFYKKVILSLNTPSLFGIIQIAIEMAEDGGPVAQVLVSTDTRKKAKVLNIWGY